MAHADNTSGKLQKENNELVASYLQVRNAIGVVGIAMPVLLLLYSASGQGPWVEVSISAYFYTGGREILVGCLFAIGVFLFAYKGFDKDDRKPTDRTVSRLAAIGAIGIAISPADPARLNLDKIPDPNWAQSVLGYEYAGYLHSGSAVLFFCSIAVFCLINFRRCEPNEIPDAAKLFRNSVFRALGWFILLCTAAFLLGSILKFPKAFVFWTEALAVWGFGLSWVIKGEAIERALKRYRAKKQSI